MDCDGNGFDLGMHSNGSHGSSAWYGLNLRFVVMNRYLALKIQLLLAGDVSLNPGPAKYQRIRTVISSNRQKRLKGGAQNGVNWNNIIPVVKSQSTLDGKFKIACVNTRSVRNKQSDFVDHLLAEDIDLCVICESHLRSDDEVVLSNITPGNYSISNCPRENRSCGGLALVYKKFLDLIQTQKGEKSSFEFAKWHLKYKGQSTMVVGVYKTPYSRNHPVTEAVFLNEFADFLENIVMFNGKLIILGDFNLHVNDRENSSGSRFLDLLESVGLVNHINVPTHNKGNTLDLIITRKDCDFEVHDVRASFFISDHSFVSVKTKLYCSKCIKKTIVFRKIKDIDIAKFKKDLSETHLCVSPSDNLDVLVSQYHDCISELLNKHAPKITKCIKEIPDCPWYTSELNKLKCERRKAEYKWRKSKSEQDHEAFKRCRNRFRNKCETKKLEYYKNKVENCEGDQKKLFKVLESLTSRKNDTPYPEHSSVDELANKFGQFFMEKIDKVRNDITEILQNENLGDHHNYENCETFSHNEFREFAELNSDQVMKLISKCSPKYCQLDPAPTAIIKDYLDILLPCITKIINLSLQTGNFPSNWKCSLVIPLLKKLGLELIFKSYRPVSNLPFISKVVESAAVKQYREYLETNDQMPKRNAAYTVYHSTETILTRVHSDILQNMDNQRVSLLVLLDLSAAFDTLDVNTLQQIFQHKFKISGQVSQWFQSYFTNRKQRILIKDVLSNEFDVKYGVPQGSCAGPVIFLSYLSSLYDLIAQYDVNVGGFADDNQLYISFKPNSESESEALNEITNCIAAVRKWMLQHKLKINDDKTELIIIGGSKQLPKVSLDSIQVGECTVSPVQKVRNLGVIFDENL